MKGFNFEKNLPHQTRAVDAVVEVLAGLEIETLTGENCQYKNPVIHRRHPVGQFYRNLEMLQQENDIREAGTDGKRFSREDIVDIMMETGTGKTYTYAKTFFELNKQYGIYKFVVVVPTLSIKAGTIDFLKSDSSRAHFKEQYGKSIKLHVVESKKAKKGKKSYIPPAVQSFCDAGNFDKERIQVLVINAGMVNSDTMQKSHDKGLFDLYTVPFDGIASVHPFVIIDEPHKFAQGNKTWKNIEKMQPQFVIRYGATFPEKEISVKNPYTKKSEKKKMKDYHNLLYKLSAVDSFNQNLVKGVIGHISEFEDGKNAVVRLISTDGTEANLELTENGKKSTVKLAKKDSLERLHPEMVGLSIEALNKSRVLLSNGMELKNGDKINPYSYAKKLQEIMLRKTVAEHFKLERHLLVRAVKIKPLTLFFIDNIEEYRSEDGYLKKLLESYVKAEVESLLETETDEFYRQYLEKTLVDLSLTHAGYFSKDNSGNDEAVEQEVNEILHDKQTMLSLENPRRFIFSKWTLREGWDNPNVFQICKLRSSGSEISKLQEVGRGLRLPVNEFGNRVKEEQFHLNYFVDFTESDFVNRLVDEINLKSGAFAKEDDPEKLKDELIRTVCEKYQIKEDQLLKDLDENNAITRSNDFKEGGYAYLTRTYPLAFSGVGTNKVRVATQKRKKVTVRTDKYHELKVLWEKLNEKVVLEYKFENEQEFAVILTGFFKDQQSNFSEKGILQRTSEIQIIDGEAGLVESPISIYANKVKPIATLSYDEFIKEVSKVLNINLQTVHHALRESEIDIHKYLNISTIRTIKQNFDDYLMYHAIDKFSIGYKSVTNQIHPTKLTDRDGKVLNEINASDVGVFHADAPVAPNYLLEELYYDSDLEKQNIEREITEVVVFTKIPKNSIKIPVAGGRSYSPDFAYVLNSAKGAESLHFIIVETKDVKSDRNLREEEKRKIKHAEAFFQGKVKIEFKTQFSNNQIQQVLQQVAGYEEG